MHDPHLLHQQLLQDTLREIFGEVDHDLLHKLIPRMRTLELPGGSILLRQGEVSDAIYLVLSGRLRATLHDPEQGGIALGEIGRGEPIGEMGVISGSPRSATVTALRDCVLLRLDASDFTEVLESWPRASLPLARKLIDRLSRSNRVHLAQKRIVNVCVLPLRAGLEPSTLCQRLRDHLIEQFGLSRSQDARVAFHDRSTVESRLGAGIADAESEQPDAYRRLLAWLDEQEALHTMQVFVADAEDSPWTRLCLRHADHVLLLAEADDDARTGLVEQRHLMGEHPSIAVTQSLWLLHPDERPIPSGTARWLQARPHILHNGLSHFHTRLHHAGDWGRLARILSGQACGLVLAGGGARGFAQLGVMQALQEQGIDWDMAGGTSIGAVMAAYAAMDLPMSRIVRLAAHAFERDPTGDLNGLPMMSFLRGRRLRGVVLEAITAALGKQVHAEDLWKPFFCIASNYSRSQMQVLRTGDLAQALLASVSIPAALPPVLWNGDLLTDGSTFNNYPVDVMRASGAARVIGVDLHRDRYRPLPYKALPPSWALFIDRFLRPRKKRRYKGLPTLGTIVFNVAVMASTAHEIRMRQDVDLTFRPDISRIGLLEWKAFRRVVDIGLQYGRQRLTELATTLEPHWYTTRGPGH
jgi:NTE family protein